MICCWIWCLASTSCGVSDGLAGYILAQWAVPRTLTIKKWQLSVTQTWTTSYNLLLKGGGGEKDFGSHMVFRRERSGVSLCQSIKEDYTKFTPKYLPMKERGRGGYKNYAELLGGSGKFYFDSIKILRPRTWKMLTLRWLFSKVS